MAPDVQPKQVLLPHDAMIEKERRADTVSEGKKGYFPDGVYDYVKKFTVPIEYKDKRVTFEFEGIYMNSMVYINGDFAGQHPYGYSNFYIKADPFLKYGEENEIRVVCKSSDDSRWYTGTGIYRNTKIIVANLVHIAVDGVKITTPEISRERAIVSVVTTVENEGPNPQKTSIVTDILDEGGHTVASDSVPLTAFAGDQPIVRQRLFVKHPKLWNVEAPNLYTCRTRVMDGANLLDEEITTFGIRSLSLDAEEGLKINGETVKLRGACIHHDNGVIGAATIDRAEERRIEILKQAGFNAIRSSHQPMSKAMLNACDRVGMLVMDESFDMWTETKSTYDYALYFPTWWEKDIEAMVSKDYNHPSVIMYSIGNEIPETGSAHGAAWGRKLAEKIRSLDYTRYVTNSINGFVSVQDTVVKMMRSNNKGSGGDVNTAMANAGDMIKHVQSHEIVTHAVAESFAAVDIAGYNYADNRYVKDKSLFPNRVICGSETFPKDIANNWKLVKENGHVIGDFTWTGWDYLGESGIGRVVYDETERGHGVSGSFPWLTAYCGDIDINGNRLPISYYREIVFGLRTEPFIAVQRPEHYGKQPIMMPWSWSDVISSWSFDGYEQQPIKVEVYANAEDVELLVNEKVVGKEAVEEFKAVFDTEYDPGEIIAVAYRAGQEISRTLIKSADSGLNLKVEADRTEIQASDSDLSFIKLSLVDDSGIVKPLADRKVRVSVKGTGILQGFGSGNPKPNSGYLDTEQMTYDGLALAVIRPLEKGNIYVEIDADGCITQTVTIIAR
jgi:beta-galactosidase